MVMEKFSEIENKNVDVPSWPRHPYADDRYGQKVKIVPIKDIRSLTISFTTDDLTAFYKSSVSIGIGRITVRCFIKKDDFPYSPITI